MSYSREELIGFMEAFDNDDLSDGAWFAMLHDGATAFIETFNLQDADAHDLVHEYLEYLQ